MTVFESSVTINRPASVIYDFLADMNNHRQLMPDDITNWASTKDTANFNIQNMAKLSLEVSKRNPFEEITIVPSEKPPFDLELNWLLAEDEGQTKVTFKISAQLNMMLKMLASGPLQKLADHETAALTIIFN